MSRAASAGRFDIRGLMLDPARLVERHEYYFDLLPDLSRWGYNTLWWHFSDDEGFTQKLDGHPELATPFAFSKAETRRFVQAARDVGIDVVPEVECLGHALFITRLPRYAHLFDGNPIGHNAVCPSHPDTLKLLREVIEEVAALFGGPYLHAGLDEANLGDCPRCRRRGRGKPPWWIFAEHAKAVHRVVTDSGKRMIVWADPVEKQPRLLKVLPKDIVLAHWHYGDVPAEKITPSVRAGFDVVCVPAVSGSLLLPNAANLQNVDDMVALAGRLPRRRSRGVVTCWWLPFRVLRDTMPLALAYAANATSTGRPAGRLPFARRFAREYFGIADRSAADALWRLHELAPTGLAPFKRFYPDSLEDVHEALKVAGDPGLADRAEEARRCADMLARGRRGVRQHRPAYDAVVLAARVLAQACENAGRFLQAYQSYRRAVGLAECKAPRADVARELDLAACALEQVSGAVAPLAKACAKEWDRTRHPKDAKKDNGSPLLRQRGAHAVLAALLQSAAFCRRWAGHARKAVRDYRRGGPVPGSV